MKPEKPEKVQGGPSNTSMTHRALYPVSDFWTRTLCFAASTYLFVPLTQQPLEKQHQLGERRPDLKLLFPALLHDLVTGERHRGGQSLWLRLCSLPEGSWGGPVERDCFSYPLAVPPPAGRFRGVDRIGEHVAQVWLVGVCTVLSSMPGSGWARVPS